MNNLELSELEQLAISEVIQWLYTDDNSKDTLIELELEVFMPENKENEQNGINR